MLSVPSISLIESISSFRLIEHQIHPIVNSIEGFPDPGSTIWPDQQQSRNREAGDAE
jgi:hypothetical protein